MKYALKLVSKKQKSVKRLLIKYDFASVYMCSRKNIQLVDIDDA